MNGEGAERRARQRGRGREMEKRRRCHREAKKNRHGETVTERDGGERDSAMEAVTGTV